MALDFEWMEPQSLDEVKHALSSGDMTTRLVSGGTALSLIMKQGIFSPERLISLKHVRQELRYIREDAQGDLRIGCLTTLHDLEVSPLLQKTAPVIVEALHHVANPRIRYVASIGGNLSHGDAHLDLPPILLAMGAKVKAESVDGERWIELEDFFRGYYETSLQPNEILTELLIPKLADNMVGTYLKYTTLSNDDWPTLGIAAFLQMTRNQVSELRLAISAVTDVPIRLTEVEQILVGHEATEALINQAADRAFEIVNPLEDLRGSVWYKKEMVKVHIRRVLNKLMQG